MPYSGAQVTRLGLAGIPRGLYGSFAGKAEGAATVARRGAGGGAKRYKRRKWWITVGGEKHRVSSHREVEDILAAYVEATAELVETLPARKQRAARISLSKARAKLALVRLDAAEEAARAHRQRLMDEDELILQMLVLH